MHDESSKPDLFGTLLNDRLIFMRCLDAGSFDTVYRTIDVTSRKHDPTYFAVKCLRIPAHGSFKEDLQERAFLSHIILLLLTYMFHDIVTEGYFAQRTDRVKVSFLHLLDAATVINVTSNLRITCFPRDILRRSSQTLVSLR